MRYLLPLLLFAAAANAQTVTTTFLISADLGNNRQAIVQASVVYPDTLEAEQYPDLVTVATELSNYLRNYPNRAQVAIEAMASGSTRQLMEKFPVATGASVLFSLGQQGSTQIAAERVKEKAPADQKKAVKSALAEFRRNAQAKR
ncbi:MAG: hypothetical protein FJW30_02870 [Acidobacteria bacterium]|nr:hypothetical protein [Acidobacteriota bacterium]